MVEADLLRLHWRPFRFSLPRELVTAHGALREKAGWLLKLEAPDGRLGWGEAASLDWGAEAAGGSAVVGASDPIPAAVACLGAAASRETQERRLPLLPPPLAFALGLALAELDGLGAGDGGWLPAPMSAQLLPAGEAMRAALERILRGRDAEAPVPRSAITFKWKVAAGEDRSERELLDWLIDQLPQDARLRLDANGGWDRTTAAAWASRLEHENRLDWLEQPLEPADREGLLQLAERLPVALDESVRAGRLPAGWPGWQVRRPAVEGDPRSLLAALVRGVPRLMVSTALETGIAWRLVAHLAALQQLGPTPTAPGLAPGWRPRGGLFAADPLEVWRSALEAGDAA